MAEQKINGRAVVITDAADGVSKLVNDAATGRVLGSGATAEAALADAQSRCADGFGPDIVTPAVHAMSPLRVETDEEFVRSWWPEAHENPDGKIWRCATPVSNDELEALDMQLGALGEDWSDAALGIRMYENARRRLEAALAQQPQHAEVPAGGEGNGWRLLALSQAKELREKDRLIASLEVAPAQSAEAVRAAAHQANEWVDATCNGIQWLKNIRDGISKPEEAIAEMVANHERICALIPTPAPTQEGPTVAQHAQRSNVVFCRDFAAHFREHPNAAEMSEAEQRAADVALMCFSNYLNAREQGLRPEPNITPDWFPAQPMRNATDGEGA